MLKNKKILIISIFLGIVFFNISSIAMENNIQEKEQDSSNETKNIIKEYKNDENEEDKKDGFNLKGEIKTKDRIVNNIKKLKLIDEEYFKHFIEFLYLAVEEEIIDNSADDVIDLIKDIATIRNMIDEEYNKKFMLVDKIKEMSSKLESINNSEEQKELDIAKFDIFLEIMLNEIERYVKNNSGEKSKYPLSKEEDKKETVHDVMQMMDKHKLNFFEKVENLIKEVEKTEKERKLKLFLLGLLNKSLKGEDIEKVEKELEKYLDSKSVFKFIDLLRPVDEITGEVNKTYIYKIIDMGEKTKSKFLEKLIDDVNRINAYRMIKLSQDNEKSGFFKEVKQRAKKEYEEYNKKMFNENNFMEEIKTTLKGIRLCLNEDVEKLQEEFRSNLEYLLKKVEDKFKNPRTDEHLEVLFKSLKGEELKNFIDKIIKLAETNDILDFLYRFECLIYSESVKPNDENLIKEIEKIIIDMKNNIEGNKGEYSKNLKILTDILYKNGVRRQTVQKLENLIINGKKECKEFFDRIIEIIKKNKNNFLIKMGIIVDGEIKIRELTRKIYSLFSKKVNSELIEDEIKEVEKDIKTIYILKHEPDADIKYHDIEFYFNAGLKRLNHRLIINVKKNSNGRYYAEYNLLNMNNTYAVENNLNDLDTDVD